MIEAFEPAPWARGGHAQTILGRYWSNHRLPGTDESVQLTLPDGDRLAILLRHIPGSTRVVTLFHGLGGSTESSYMPRIAAVFANAGYSVILANHRGCGAGAGLAASPYHSGRADDISAVIRFGRERFPDHAHLAIGFSLSGNALLLLLGARPDFTQPDAAIAVNAPIDLARAAELLHQGFNRVYDLRFVADARREIAGRQKAGLLREAVHIPPFATLMDVDQIYTAPFGGFKSREDYYARASAGPHLPNIHVPTVALTAADDPFVDVAAYLAAKSHARLTIQIEKSGGHMGYLSGALTPLRTRHWLDYALLKHGEALLQS